MLHEIGVELQAALQSRGCPFPVIDGPERRPTTTFARERIVIEHDDKADDAFEAKHLATRNPKSYCTRKMAAKLTIYAAEPRPGATEFEHRRRVEHVLDQVIVSMYELAQARHNWWAPKSGRFVLPDDFSKTETVGGAVYELKFTFDRGIADRKWSGAIQPQITPANTTIEGSPALTFSGNTITRSAGSWVADGFAVGMSITIAGTAHNDGVYAITSVAPLVLTVGSSVATEGPVSGASGVTKFFNSSTTVSITGGDQDEPV